MNSVVLGLAGNYTTPETEPSHYATKVGGLAWLPGHRLATRGKDVLPDLSCLVCKAQLSLVVQAYAPLAQSQDRVLLLFGCCAPGCGWREGSWRAFCCQLAPDPPREEIMSTAADDAPKTLVGGESLVGSQAMPLSSDPFGFGGNDEDFLTAPSGQTNGASSSECFDFSDLDAALDKSVASSSCAKASKQKGMIKDSQTSGNRAQAPFTSTFTLECRWPVLPEFLLVAVEEPEGDERAGKKELDHARDLYARYQQLEENGDLEEEAAAQGGVDTDAEGGRAASSVGAEGKGKEALSWAGEEYEEDQVKGVIPSYLKFAALLQRMPEQCVRYCHGGRLLWPTPFPPEPGECPRCGSPRVLEMQLMSPLISMILEASGEVEVDNGVVPMETGRCSAPIASQMAINGAGNWDVCTVAVFTCSASCSPGFLDNENWMIEEGVRLVTETDCHTE